MEQVAFCLAILGMNQNIRMHLLQQLCIKNNKKEAMVTKYQ
jgi:hypothetical protein